MELEANVVAASIAYDAGRGVQGLTQTTDGRLRIDSATSAARLVLSTAPSFTRPADTTAYTAGDLVANSTTAASVVPMEFAGVASSPGGWVNVRRVTLKKSTATITAATFSLILSQTNAVPSSGDNAAFVGPAKGNVLGGAFNLSAPYAMVDGAVSVSGSSDTLLFKTADGSTSLFGFLVAAGAYAPGNAEVFEVSLMVERL